MPLFNCPNLLRVSTDLTFLYYESQEADFLRVELTFLSFSKKLVLQEALKDKSDVLVMFLKGL